MRSGILILLLLLTKIGLGQTTFNANNLLLWEVKKKGSKEVSYVYGTIHLNNPRLFQFSDSVYYAFNRTKFFSPEIEIQDLFSLQVNKLNTDLLVDAENRIYKSTRWRNKVNYGSIYGRPQFLDAYFYQIAVNSGKKVAPLELMSDQMNAYKSITFTEYSPTVSYSEEDMIDLYLTGNIYQLQKLIYQSFKGSNGYEELIAKRNTKMIEKIDSIIKVGSTFVAVGAGHLSGQNGLITLLRAKGYEVRAVSSTYQDRFPEIRKLFKENHQYIFKDDEVGYQIKFGMKPIVTQEDEFIHLESRDLGQGNVYILDVEKILDESLDIKYYLDENFFLPVNAKIEKAVLENGLEIYEGIVEIEEYGLSKKRILIKDGYLYKMTCSGSLPFLNSNRPKDFFESLFFTK